MKNKLVGYLSTLILLFSIFIPARGQAEFLIRKAAELRAGNFGLDAEPLVQIHSPPLYVQQIEHGAIRMIEEAATTSEGGLKDTPIRLEVFSKVSDDPTSNDYQLEAKAIYSIRNGAVSKCVDVELAFERQQPENQATAMTVAPTVMDEHTSAVLTPYTLEKPSEYFVIPQSFQQLQKTTYRLIYLSKLAEGITHIEEVTTLADSRPETQQTFLNDYYRDEDNLRPRDGYELCKTTGALAHAARLMSIVQRVADGK